MKGRGIDDRIGPVSIEGGIDGAFRTDIELAAIGCYDLMARVAAQEVAAELAGFPDQ
jgi:hypothetical protein